MTVQKSDQFALVAEAFTRQSSNYDQYEEGNHILKWMRQQVRNHALEFLKPGDKILELNSGTGIDAEFFAEKGFTIHCTDLTSGMINQMQNKFSNKNLSDKITLQQCSYTELDKIGDRKFDMIFSNFGGLNCIPDLNEVTKFFPSLLNNKGEVCLVIMPPLCPWELIQSLRGKFKFAVRRLNKNGTLANIEGIIFTTFYFTPGEVMKALGKNFKLQKLEGLAVFTPNPQMTNFSKKFPRLIKALNKLDEKFAGLFPLNRIGDHFILTAKYIQSQTPG